MSESQAVTDAPRIDAEPQTRKTWHAPATRWLDVGMTKNNFNLGSDGSGISSHS